MTAPKLDVLIAHPSVSTVCARCDGRMVMRKNAVGIDVPRCPKCSPLAPNRRPHPDDAQLPQGLVRAAVLPQIEPGQLRCQVCACGVSVNDRWCKAHRGAGLLLVQAMRNERNARSGR